MCSVLYAPPVPAPWLRLCKIKHISPSHTLYLFFSHPPLACIHTFFYCTGFSATAILSFIKSLHSILCAYLLLKFSDHFDFVWFFYSFFVLSNTINWMPITVEIKHHIGTACVWSTVMFFKWWPLNPDYFLVIVTIAISFIL